MNNLYLAGNISKQDIVPTAGHFILILLHATFPGVPSYGGKRTWVEGSQMRIGWSLQPISLLRTVKLQTINAEYIRLINTD